MQRINNFFNWISTVFSVSKLIHMPNKKKINLPGEPVDPRSSDPYILLGAVFIFILFIGLCLYLAFAKD